MSNLQLRGLPAVAAIALTHKKRAATKALQKEQESLTQQVANWEKSLTLLSKHSPDDPRIPSLVEQIATARIGDFGQQQQNQIPGIPQGTAPRPQATPQPRQQITPSFGPLSTSVKQFEQGRSAFQKSTTAAEKAQSGQERAVRVAAQKEVVKAAVPSEGLRNQYKSVGSQMVKLAENIKKLESLVPQPEAGFLGIGDNERQIELAQIPINQAKQQLADLQKRSDGITKLAGDTGKTLDFNEWDIFLSSNPASTDLANSEQNPANPTTQAEYDALPTGAWYIHPTKGPIQKTAVKQAGVL